MEAQRRTDELQLRSDENARLAEQKNAKLDDANEKRKKAVQSSGRSSTLLTGTLDDSKNKTLLGG